MPRWGRAQPFTYAGLLSYVGAPSGIFGAVAQANESDLAQAVTWNPKRRVVVQALENDLAQPITHRKTKTLGQAN
jgi:hypothetical protein